MKTLREFYAKNPLTTHLALVCLFLFLAFPLDETDRTAFEQIVANIVVAGVGVLAAMVILRIMRFRK